MCAGELASGSDARRGLRGQGEAELVYEQLLIGIELGVAAQNQDTAVGGREVDVEHLHGCQLVEDRPGREAASQRFEPGTQRNVEAVGNERDEDVCFDALLELVIDGAQAEVVLEILEGRLDLGQLDVELPQVGRVLPTQIGAQSR